VESGKWKVESGRTILTTYRLPLFTIFYSIISRTELLGDGGGTTMAGIGVAGFFGAAALA
jgi:hypothetical protein